MTQASVLNSRNSVIWIEGCYFWYAISAITKIIKKILNLLPLMAGLSLRLPHFHTADGPGMILALCLFHTSGLSHLAAIHSEPGPAAAEGFWKKKGGGGCKRWSV